jgi:hypothetical protein
MGIIRMGIPEDITIFIRECFNIMSIIETGTFYGGTANWASRNFEKVYTIEFAEEIYNQTKQQLGHIPNVQFLFGDSREVLSKLLPDAEQSVIWLDAHWCSMGSYGVMDQCPLLREIEIVNLFDKDHFILIDDARLFLAPPPLPNLISFYPDINQLVNLLIQKNRKIYIYEDVIFAIPENAQVDFCEFLQNKTTTDWLEYGENLRIKNEFNYSKTRKVKFHLKELLKLLLKK